MKLSDAIDQFLLTYELRSANTLDSYHSALGLFVEWTDDPELESLTSATIDAYATHLHQRLKLSSIYRYMQIIRTLLGWCVSRGYLSASPSIGATSIHQPDSTSVGFTPTEVKDLIVATSQLTGWYELRARALVMLLVGTGARAGEACALRKSHIDWDSGRIRLQGKGNKERVVPMGRMVRETMFNYISGRPVDPDAVFVSGDGRSLSYSALRNVVLQLGDLSGVKECRLHKFRHTYASQWFREHRDPIALRNLLGHSDVQTTEGYLRSLGESYGMDFRTPDEWLTA